ncbi:hypothetical protein F5B18DRAFT_158878 [Nemania serpens]|nr:hypothetical protein F5B18DRAFT_158878 [Nemania serpens]
MASPSLSASDDRALPCMAGAGMPASSDSCPVGLLANLSGRRSSCGRPTSPTQASKEGGDDLMILSDKSQKKKDAGSDAVFLVIDDNDASPQPNKGKAPDRIHLLSDSDQKPSTKSYEVASIDDETSSPDTQPEFQYTRSSSSPLEEANGYRSAAAPSTATDQIALCKKKQDEKADPEAETASLSKALEVEKPFQPLSFGDPGWEKSAGRTPQKLPIRFRDAVGRNFVFPWEKVKTWTGMRGLIQSCFIHVDALGPHVTAGRYDLSINLPFPKDAANDILSPVTPLTPPPVQATTSTAESSSSSAADLSSTSGASSNTNSTQQQQHNSSFVVLPELWEDTIEPGMLVVQHMWPFQTLNHVAQPAQPSPQPPPLPHILPPALYPVGRGRGTGRGAFGGRGALPPPPPVAPFRVVDLVRLKPKGKTRKRQDRG